MASQATKMVREKRPVSEPVKPAGIVSPTENEIATVAFQLWLDSGCPVGSDQEHWFRAEAMLTKSPVAKYGDLSRRPSIPRCDTRTESETVAEFTLERICRTVPQANPQASARIAGPASTPNEGLEPLQEFQLAKIVGRRPHGSPRASPIARGFTPQSWALGRSKAAPKRQFN